MVDVAIFGKGNQAPICLNNHLEALLAHQKVCVIPYFFSKDSRASYSNEEKL